MKIAIVTDTYRPRVNGVVTSIDTFAEQFRKLGHEVKIVAPEFPHMKHEGGAADTEKDVIRIKSHYLFFDPEDRLPNPWLPSMKKKIREEILSAKFDIIHTQTPFTLGIAAIRWAREMNCPIVHTYHTLFQAYTHYIGFLPKRLSLFLVKKFSLWYCSKMDLNVTPSTPMGDILRSYGVKTPVETSATGIRNDKFKNCNGAAFRKKNGIAKDTILLLFMGRLGDEKNVPFLYDVLKKLQPLMPKKVIKLIIAGEGPAGSALEKAARAAGVEKDILHFGYLNDRDWADCYAAADIFTFASLTETQGLVVTEAMAAGTPVIAVNRMGVSEVMAGERGGFLCEADTGEFARKVVQLLENKSLYAKKKREAVASAAAWSAAAKAGLLLDKYEKTITIHNRESKY